MVKMINEEKIYQNLVKHFFSLKTKKQIDNFLRSLLTSQEIGDLSRRLEIVKKLKKQEPQHQIAADMGVGVATVTRGSKAIQEGAFKSVKIE